MVIVETMTSDYMPSIEALGSLIESFIFKKFQYSANAWSIITNWPAGMLNVLLKSRVHRSTFSQFNFRIEEINDVISNHDDDSKEWIMFGRRIYLSMI